MTGCEGLTVDLLYLALTLKADVSKQKLHLLLLLATEAHIVRIPSKEKK